MAKQKRKPTGTRGPVHIHGSLRDGFTIEHQRIEFPDAKADVEQLVVSAFVDAASKAGKLPAPFIDIQPNPENDFDFVDAGAERPTYVELMEIAPLEGVKGGYEGAPTSYKGYDFAESTLAKILGKSARYCAGDGTRLVLLLYVTDWRFSLSDAVIALLQYWTLNKAHVFSEIYAFRPSSLTDGKVYLIFPTPRDFWKGFDPEKRRENVTYPVDPGSWKLAVERDG